MIPSPHFQFFTIDFSFFSGQLVNVSFIPKLFKSYFPVNE